MNQQRSSNDKIDLYSAKQRAELALIECDKQLNRVKEYNKKLTNDLNDKNQSYTILSQQHDNKIAEYNTLQDQYNHQQIELLKIKNIYNYHHKKLT